MNPRTVTILIVVLLPLLLGGDTHSNRLTPNVARMFWRYVGDLHDHIAKDPDARNGQQRFDEAVCAFRESILRGHSLRTVNELKLEVAVAAMRWADQHERAMR